MRAFLVCVPYFPYSRAPWNTGKIKKFYSYCGGIPAPECANNPLMQTTLSVSSSLGLLPMHSYHEKTTSLLQDSQEVHSHHIAQSHFMTSITSIGFVQPVFL
jgi:hypothetical protein